MVIVTIGKADLVVMGAILGGGEWFVNGLLSGRSDWLRRVKVQPKTDSDHHEPKAPDGYECAKPGQDQNQAELGHLLVEILNCGNQV